MKKGFTLVEVIVVFVIIAVIAAVAIPIIVGGGHALRGSSNISVGLNGMTESRCIDGYKFIIGEGGQARQIMDAYGKGIPCR